MKVGFSANVTSESVDVAILARRGEELGYDSFWIGEHPIIPVNATSAYPGTPDGSIPRFMPHMVDPFVSLARASGVTQRLKLGTAVCLIPEHNPLLLAKEVATLDYLSGGRFMFGIGAGWLKEETEIMGGSFPHRWGQTREAILAMKELWTKEEAEFHGTFYDFPLVRSFPKPSQEPHPPILLGGSARNVFKRIASWGDGWIPTRALPEQVKVGRATLDELAVAAGRDPRSIDISVSGASADPGLMRSHEEAGADRVIVRLSTSVGEAALSELESGAAQLRPWLLT